MKKLDRYNKRVLVTGGAGFIGSELVHQLVEKYPDYLIVNFDALTYAGNLENLKDIENEENYVFFKGDIRNSEDVATAFQNFHITDVIHMAAESHVDRSMVNPTIFAETNVMGTLNLLNYAREYWKEDYSKHKFVNMGTDEIFGALDIDSPRFCEETPLAPHSPYSTSKASAVMLGKTYYEAYGLPVVNMASTNAIGPRQFPEKLVPLTLDRIIHNEKIPVYGKGEQIRDWIYVSDFAEALILVLEKGVPGELYCIGGDSEQSNIGMIYAIIQTLVGMLYKDGYVWKRKYEQLIKFIPDPRGKSHDFRYGIDHSKITKELGWKPKHKFDESVKETVQWYLNNQEWVEHCKSGEYKNWIKEYYNGK